MQNREFIDSILVMTLSVIIVNYNVREFLGEALSSILRAVKNISAEIIVVDNASSDGSVEYIKANFPSVRVVRNAENVGFARANNQAIQLSIGKYICLINPDTIVQEDTFSVLLKFMDEHPEAGAAGCKILNPDGSLQLACRRSFPTPWVAFTKISGLAYLFPKSRLFGRYNLTYLDPDAVSDVEAISGSFMLVRRETIDRVGLLDESFFMYGEDLDWCFRIRQGGWKIYYVPTTQIIHFKGESSKKSPFEQRRLFYEAMRLFVEKHFSKGKALVPSWLLILSIRIRTLLAFVSAAVRYLALPLFDWLIMTGALALAIYLRFHPEYPWRAFLIVHALYSLVWLSALALHGLYGKWKFSAGKSFSAIILGWMVNSAITFFLKQIAFSRAVVIYAGVINAALIPGWRFLFKWLVRWGVGIFRDKLGQSILSKRTLIVGDAESADTIIRKLRTRVQMLNSIRGVVLAEPDESIAKVAGVPVIGSLDYLHEIIPRERIQEVIFSTDRLPYDKILSTIAASNGSQISFKLVPSNLSVIIGKAVTEHLDDVPLVDIEYKYHYKLLKALKRGFDVALAMLITIVTFPVYAWLRWVKRVPIESYDCISANGETIKFEKFVARDHKSHWWSILPLMKYIVHGDISFVGRELESGCDTNLTPISQSLKPGLTGLEQINRNLNLTDEDREKYHLYYLKNYSPLLDVEIILKSLFRV